MAKRATEDLNKKTADCHCFETKVMLRAPQKGTFIAKPFFSTGQLFDSQGTLRAALPVRRKADTHTCNVRGIGALDGKAIPFQQIRLL